MRRVDLIEAAIRSLDSGQQAALAVDLASLVLPFAEISPAGQPACGLTAVAAAIRAASGKVEIDRERHVLWSTPELLDEDEPEGPSWYSLGATVTWIFASDSLTTAPADGAVNAFKRVVDLLDAADEALGDASLVDGLLDSVDAAVGAGTHLVVMPVDFRSSVRRAAKRLAPAT